MARILFVAIFALCLVCVLQANPVPDQDPQPSPLDDVNTALNAAFASAKKQYQEFVDDPAVKKMFDDATKLALEGVNALRQQADKVLPKTE